MLMFAIKVISVAASWRRPFAQWRRYVAAVFGVWWPLAA
jgi:hypothetical protein